MSPGPPSRSLLALNPLTHADKVNWQISFRLSSRAGFARAHDGLPESRGQAVRPAKRRSASLDANLLTPRSPDRAATRASCGLAQVIRGSGGSASRLLSDHAWSWQLHEVAQFNYSPLPARSQPMTDSLRRVRHALPSSSDHGAACLTSGGTLVTYWGNVRFRERRRWCERRAWRTRPSSRGCMRHARRGFRRRQRPASHRNPARLQSATFGSRTASPLRELTVPVRTQQTRASEVSGLTRRGNSLARRLPTAALALKNPGENVRRRPCDQKSRR